MESALQERIYSGQRKLSSLPATAKTPMSSIEAMHIFMRHQFGRQTTMDLALYSYRQEMTFEAFASENHIELREVV